MNAAQFQRYGGLEVIELRDVPEPELSSGHLLVEAHSASVNPFDWKLRSGMFKDMIPLSLPITLGGDFSGTVKSIGDGVAGFAVGDEVYGNANVVSGGSGAFAEIVRVSVDSVSHKPKHATMNEAAALPLVGVSALQALTEHMNLKSAQRLLIHGGAGGIGSVAIQLAKHLGVYVIATARGEDAEFVRGLGADEVIDYKTQSFIDLVRGVDAVFDMVGGEVCKQSFAVLKRGGVLVSMNEQPDPQCAQDAGVTVFRQSSHVNRIRLETVAAFVDEGAIRIFVDRVFPLAETAAAMDYLEHGHHRGKVVIAIKNLSS